MGFLKTVTLMKGKGLLFLMRGGNPKSAVFVVQVLWGIVVLASVFIIKHLQNVLLASD
jgi:hypothetical protein